MLLRNTLLYLITFLVLTSGSQARACNIPVFRYALERWRNDQPEDRYPLTVFHRGPLNDADSKLVQSLRKVGAGRHALAPCAVETVDLAGPVGDADQRLWQTQTNAQLPWLVVRSPASVEDRTPLWSRRLDENTVQRLTDSPARHEIARRIMNGAAIVWVYLETGDANIDDRIVGQVAADLHKLEKTLQLPDADPDDTVRLLSTLPLAVKLSVLRVRRNDAAEGFFVQSLLRSLKEAVAPTEPLLFPVFGRGRVLDGLIGKGVNADNLKDAGQFLCGACSCQVKRLNPGTDLLIAADWDAVLTDPDAIEPEPTPQRERRVPLPAAQPEPQTANALPVANGTNLPLLVAIAVVAVLVFVTGGLALRAKVYPPAPKGYR